MKMKKFINAPETITDEELVGLGLAYPDILDVDGHLVVSRDLAGADRVTIVTYGGSGHEPAQASPPRRALWARACWTCRRWATSSPPPTASWSLTP